MFQPHVVTLTQVGTSVYLGQTHLGTPFQVPVWVRKFSLGSTGDEISSKLTCTSQLLNDQVIKLFLWFYQFYEFSLALLPLYRNNYIKLIGVF